MIQSPLKMKGITSLKSIIIILAPFIFFPAALLGQAQPANKKADPVGAPIRPRSVTDNVEDIRERLVKLAMQNPNFEIADRKVAIAGYQVKKAKGSWWGAIAVQGNINEFAFNGATSGTVPLSTFYPKYNIGANIPFDMFSAKKNDIKIARENLSIAEAEKNQRFREIKADVLTKYEDYLMWQQKLNFQTQLAQDARTAYLTAEKDFQEGAIKQEDYNKSYSAYIEQQNRQLEAIRNFNVVKLDLEKIIGISMDDLLKK